LSLFCTWKKWKSPDPSVLSSLEKNGENRSWRPCSGRRIVHLRLSLFRREEHSSQSCFSLGVVKRGRELSFVHKLDA
jgi:hypothetical protein